MRYTVTWVEVVDGMIVLLARSVSERSMVPFGAQIASLPSNPTGRETDAKGPGGKDVKGRNGSRIKDQMCTNWTSRVRRPYRAPDSEVSEACAHRRCVPMDSSSSPLPSHHGLSDREG